ncbi:nuclear transport factor 2 family protein [Spirosoma endbachense]|uniref:Nuclear transport factor 2 family protein n=1 Tax=Spirosoma endbachense TaxID=2666025 RepID=A0A6P1W3X8_9BACT|nr:nuclear transport factor 2 family protein [Spirosoma endbachense]QHW00162.1 nuclear transport factor 2 family protein [Spirosoma endbachense]
MKTNENERGAIEQALKRYYFQGIYEGNVDLLNKVFFPGAFVFGDVKGKPYAKTLAEYLDGVAHRTSPKDSGQPYETEIIEIDVINSIAVAKVRVTMYEFNYYDFLAFHQLDGQWVIVNKLLTHVER